MNCVVFDDLGLLRTALGVPDEKLQVFGPAQSGSLDDYFSAHCARKLRNWSEEPYGLVVLHAHGKFSLNSRRQDVEGVEILKHIRLSPWLGQMCAWHAVVCSFESLDQILKRKPGNLLLQSPGTTFLHLPMAGTLQIALADTYGNAALTLEDVTRASASLDRRSFMPYVACDYTPPDSAHETSNRWGLYEMWPPALSTEFPELDPSQELPEDVLSFVLSLAGKKARWLEGARAMPVEARGDSILEPLRGACCDKQIVLVDDEGQRGWTKFLRLLTGKNADNDPCPLWTPDLAWFRRLLEAPLETKDSTRVLEELAAQIRSRNPDLVILDLRLAGAAEFVTLPSRATGMQLAQILRRSEAFLPILLFTASNKAETLLISTSHDIDQYWMKPGLGEHRGLGSRTQDLASLAHKIEHLVGPDYVWLQRAAREVSAIMDAPTASWWWERAIKWPAPVRADNKSVSGLIDPIKTNLTHQPARTDVRTALRELLSPMMEALRIALRLELRDIEDDGLPTPELLRAGVFNQIGKVVELVHGFTDSTIPDEFQSAGTVGGRGDKEAGFVFFRRDWWAFRLFALRNEWSHVRVVDQNNRFAVLTTKRVTGPGKEDTVAGVSELLAWLTVANIKATPQEIQGGSSQQFRLCPADRLPPGQYDWTRLTSKAAASRDFYEALATRPEYQPLIAKADKLKTLSRKVAKA